MRVKEHVGSIIKALRLRRGITRQALADMVGLSYEGLKNIENGRRQSNEVTLKAIAQALGYTLESLLQFDQGAPTADGTEVALTAPKPQPVIPEWVQFPQRPEDWQVQTAVPTVCPKDGATDHGAVLVVYVHGYAQIICPACGRRYTA